MAGNTIGQLFAVTTFGESHGPALGAVIDGCPPGIEISEDEIQVDLDRRRPGQSKYTTQRKEKDRIQILSGVFEGKTTGTSIGLLIQNEDQKSKDYEQIKNIYRPAHADFTYQNKYGIRDYRGGGRSSARETSMRVAAGAIAKKFLSQQLGISIYGFLSAIGEINVPFVEREFIDQNPFFSADPDSIENISRMIDDIRKQGDSIGAQITVVANGVPIGLGEPVFGKLDSELAGAFMGINAVKAVEIGDGVEVVRQKGSEHRDEMTKEGFVSNHSGGILGGISSGQDVLAKLSLKPTSSITVPGRSIDQDGNEVEVITKGRHDPCVGIRATPIAESMMAIILMDHYLRFRGQVGTNT